LRFTVVIVDEKNCYFAQSGSVLKQTTVLMRSITFIFEEQQAASLEVLLSFYCPLRNDTNFSRENVFLLEF